MQAAAVTAIVPIITSIGTPKRPTLVKHRGQQCVQICIHLLLPHDLPKHVLLQLQPQGLPMLVIAMHDQPLGVIAVTLSAADDVMERCLGPVAGASKEAASPPMAGPSNKAKRKWRGFPANRTGLRRAG